VSLSEDAFWKLIDRTLDVNIENQMSKLEAELSTLTQAEIGRFYYLELEAYWNAQLWSLSDFADLTLEAGGSQFQEFAHWLVFRGEKIYREALANPDSLTPILRDYDRNTMLRQDGPFTVVIKCLDARFGDVDFPTPKRKKLHGDHGGDPAKLFPMAWKEFGENSGN